MVVFGDKSAGQYIETEFSETEERIIVKWVNYPSEIIYYHNVSNKEHYENMSEWLHDILKDNQNSQDIFQARRVLEFSFYKENTIKSAAEIRELKNKAFDNMSDDDYWFGVFDALRWVLGDEVEEFNNV